MTLHRFLPLALASAGHKTHLDRVAAVVVVVAVVKDVVWVRSPEY